MNPNSCRVGGGRRMVLGLVLGAVLLGGLACREKSDSANEDWSSISERENRPASSKKKKGKVMIKQESGDWTPDLNEAEKNTLFAIARDTLEWCVRKKGGAFSFDSYSITPRLKQEMATFVTLKARGQLRGCIGSLSPVAPLYKSVHDNAINAALRDSRFSPVSPGELAGLEVHISILSNIVEIPSIRDFQVGKHGIIIEKGPYRAVYLPEVAVEQNWTKEETLSSLSLKAGMSRDGWKTGAKFKVFYSVVLDK